MSFKRKNRRLACLLAGIAAYVFLLASCREPVRNYDFVYLDPLQGWEKDFPVRLQVDMKDTLNECELYFSLRLRENSRLNDISRYPLTLVFTSPGGIVYRDTFSLPSYTEPPAGNYQSRHGVREIERLYRGGIRNREGGIWQIDLLQRDPALYYGNISGVGVYCKQGK